MTGSERFDSWDAIAWTHWTDSRVALIFLASFALHPGRRPAYADLRDELNVRSFPRVVERIRIQWPDVLDTSDTPRARFLLTELISGAMARLTAKLEAHEDHADELAANRKIQARYDATPQGEQMQRAELRFEGAFRRSIAAFQQYRKEKKNAGELNDEGGLAPSPAKADDNPWVAEVEVAERPSPRRKPRTRGRRRPVADPGLVQIPATARDSQRVAGVELAQPASPRRSPRPTAEIEPVEPKPVVELASAVTKMTSKANPNEPESAGELASAETKMTSEPNLVQPENAGELASAETKMTSEPNLVQPENAGELASAETKMTSEPNLVQPESAGELGLVQIQAMARDSQWVAGVELAQRPRPRPRRRPRRRPRPKAEIESGRTGAGGRIGFGGDKNDEQTQSGSVGACGRTM